MIRLKTKEMYGYDIGEFSVSKLIDSEGTFQVYTAFLDIEDWQRNYNDLLEHEWEVSKALDLYDNNTILRFL